MFACFSKTIFFLSPKAKHIFFFRRRQHKFRMRQCVYVVFQCVFCIYIHIYINVFVAPLRMPYTRFWRNALPPLPPFLEVCRTTLTPVSGGMPYHPYTHLGGVCLTTCTPICRVKTKFAIVNEKQKKMLSSEKKFGKTNTVQSVATLALKRVNKCSTNSLNIFTTCKPQPTSQHSACYCLPKIVDDSTFSFFHFGRQHFFVSTRHMWYKFIIHIINSSRSQELGTGKKPEHFFLPEFSFFFSILTRKQFFFSCCLIYKIYFFQARSADNFRTNIGKHI